MVQNKNIVNNLNELEHASISVDTDIKGVFILEIYDGADDVIRVAVLARNKAIAKKVAKNKYPNSWKIFAVEYWDLLNA